jgi:hypothetical protein
MTTLQPKSQWFHWSSKMTSKPDYRMSVVEVYTEFTLQCIKHDNSFWILSTLEDASLRQIESLPSWVPDLTVQGDGHQVNLCQTGIYSAGNNTPPTSSWAPDKKGSLKVQATFCGGIYSIETGNVKAKQPQGDRTLEWLQMCRDASTAYDDYEDALWRTVIGDRVPNDGTDGEWTHPAPEPNRQNFKACLFGLEYEEGLPDDPDEQEKELEDRLKSMEAEVKNLAEDYQGADTFRVRFVQLSEVMMYGKRFFITYDGHYGMAPASADVDDTVVVLSGSDVPFVVRGWDDGTYDLVGECYLHGAMHGERIQAEDLNEWDEIELV